MKKILFGIFLLLSSISFSNFTSRHGGTMYCLKIGNVTEIRNSEYSFKAGLCRISPAYSSKQTVIRNVTVVQSGRGDISRLVQDDFKERKKRLVYGIFSNYLKYDSKTNKLSAYISDPFNPDIKVIPYTSLRPAEEVEEFIGEFPELDYNTFISDYYNVYN